MKSKKLAGTIMMLCMFIYGGISVNASGFSPDFYINGLNETLDEFNEQMEDSYDKIISDFNEEVERIREEEAAREKELEEQKEAKIIDNFTYNISQVVYDSKNNILNVEGFFSNTNEAYEIKDLSDVVIYLFSENGQPIAQMVFDEADVEDIILSPESTEEFNFHTIGDFDEVSYLFENCSSELSCGFEYYAVENNLSESSSNVTWENQTGAYMGYYPEYTDPYNNRPVEADCPLCENGKVVCKSCGGAGYFVSIENSINLGSGSTKWEKKTTCRTCNGSKMQICTGCGGDGVL